MTTIFRDGRGFVPTTIFVPQYGDNQFDFHDKDDVTLIQSQTQTPVGEQNDANTDLRDTAYSTYQKLFRTDDDIQSFNINIGDETDIFKMTFDKLAEKRLRSDAENDYKTFIAIREVKIRAEQKRLQDMEDYNRELDEKLTESKQRAADKKKQDAQRIESLKGLLLGDEDDPSIPKPMLNVLNACIPEFFKAYKLRTGYIYAIDKISPVAFDYGGGYYRPIRDVSVKCRIKPRKQMIFAGTYRTWCQQFVRKIIEKRQRGPPIFQFLLNTLFKSKHPLLTYG